MPSERTAAKRRDDMVYPTRAMDLESTQERLRRTTRILADFPELSLTQLRVQEAICTNVREITAKRLG